MSKGIMGNAQGALAWHTKTAQHASSSFLLNSVNLKQTTSNCHYSCYQSAFSCSLLRFRNAIFVKKQLNNREKLNETAVLYLIYRKTIYLDYLTLGL